MKHSLSIFKYIVVLFLSALASTALAQAVTTMNQPDNGFNEAPDPEWATGHSTDAGGTPEHREYHRDGVKAHLVWHEENQPEQGTAAHSDAHRLFHQDRNTDHREFHTASVNP